MKLADALFAALNIARITLATVCVISALVGGIWLIWDGSLGLLSYFMGGLMLTLVPLGTGAIIMSIRDLKENR